MRMNSRSMRNVGLRSSLDRQRGTAIVETAIWLPVLVLLFGAIIDILFISPTYLGLAQISREALLTGAHAPSIVGSQSNLDPSLAEYKDCLTDPSGANCAHKVMHWRVRRLLESNRIQFKSGTLQINSSFDSTKNNVAVNVKGQPTGVLGIFSGVPLAGKALCGYIGI